MSIDPPIPAMTVPTRPAVPMTALRGAGMFLRADVAPSVMSRIPAMAGRAPAMSSRRNSSQATCERATCSLRDSWERSTFWRIAALFSMT